MAWPDRGLSEVWIIIPIWRARCANAFQQSDAHDVEIVVLVFVVEHEDCVWPLC